MKVLFFGSDDFSVPVLKMLDARHTLVGVVTQPDKPKGRGKKIQSNPVAEWSLRRNKRIFYDMNDSNIFLLDVDIGVVAAYGKIIPEKLINFPKYRLINLHPSLLPRYRGATPIESAILNGDRKTGCSLIYVEKKLDAGDILAVREYLLEGRENSMELRRILSEIGAEMTIDLLENVNNISPIKQDDSLAVYTKKMIKSDGKISFETESACRIDRKIRAYINIGSYFYLNGKRLIVEEADFEDVDSGKQAGCIISSKDRLAVQTKKGIIYIKRVRPAGKGSMTMKQFLNGYKGDLY